MSVNNAQTAQCAEMCTCVRLESRWGVVFETQLIHLFLFYSFFMIYISSSNLQERI